MQTLVDELRKQNAAQAEQITQLQQQLQALEQENALLRQQKQYLLHRMFGRKSEKVDPRQMELLLGLPAAEVVTEPKVQPPPVSSRSRVRRERKPRIPENLPTEDIILEPDEVKQAPQAYRLIGEEITQEIDMIPPKYFRRRYIRRKYASKQQREVAPIMAALPLRLIPGGYAGPGFVADTVLKKYLEHMPLYRQEQMLRLRYGIVISRKTMCDWIRGIGVRSIFPYN